MSDNPFLLPPDGAKPTRPPAVPDAAPAADPTHYIAVPASVESATHRIVRSEPPAEPTASPPATPSATPSADPPAALPADAVAEETRVAPIAPRAARWVLELPDGSRLPLTGGLLIGRDPAAIADRSDATLLALSDPGKTVSKTHALLEPVPEGVRVRELHSTNGVAVDGPDGRQVADAGGELVAPAGSTILLGSFAIGVRAD